MPGALSAIAAILRQTPLILAAADALVARTRRSPAPTTQDLDSLRQKIAELEQHQQANAALARELADATTTLATALQANAVKARQAFLLAIAALVIAAAVLLVALLR